MLKLPIPEPEYITVTTNPSEFQQTMVAELGERADAVRNRLVEPSVDNMLRITSDGRKLALDQRLQNPLLPDNPDSKVNACIKNVITEWKNSTDILGTQLVFCDLSTPSLKRPIEMVPAGENSFGRFRALLPHSTHRIVSSPKISGYNAFRLSA